MRKVKDFDDQFRLMDRILLEYIFDKFRLLKVYFCLKINVTVDRGGADLLLTSSYTHPQFWYIHIHI